MSSAGGVALPTSESLGFRNAHLNHARALEMLAARIAIDDRNITCGNGAAITPQEAQPRA